MNRYTREQMAARVARDIPNGAYVNLGIGLPTMVANHLPKDREIILHTENGLLGMGPAPEAGAEDADLINAGKQPVTALPGASFFHHADSFAMMRGGHLDCCVLGAFQVSVGGRSRQLAHRREGRHSRRRRRDGPRDRREERLRDDGASDKEGRSRRSSTSARIRSPGLGCVNRIYTDLAVIDVTPQGLKVIEMVDGMTLPELTKLSGVPLTMAAQRAAA